MRILTQLRECSFEKCWGGAGKRGTNPRGIHVTPPNQYGIYMTPPNPVRNLHDPPPQKKNPLYLRSEFIEHLYHMSHNAMTSVMYFKQFGRTTLF